jgi:hypothetical protein
MSSRSFVVYSQLWKKKIASKKFYNIHDCSAHFQTCCITIFVEQSATKFQVTCYLEAPYRKVVLVLQTTNFQMLCLPVVL